MNDLESKKGKALFLLSVDLKGAYDRVDSVTLYKRLKDNGLPSEWHPYVFNLLFRRTFKVTCQTGNSSSWIPLRIGVPQGLPSAPILFNLFINATLSLTRGAKVHILTRMATPSAYRPVPTNPVESSYTRLVLSSTPLKGPIERSKAFLPNRKVYLFVFPTI
jgi:hypothetical protein